MPPFPTKFTDGDGATFLLRNGGSDVVAMRVRILLKQVHGEPELGRAWCKDKYFMHMLRLELPPFSIVHSLQHLAINLYLLYNVFICTYSHLYGCPLFLCLDTPHHDIHPHQSLHIL